MSRFFLLLSILVCATCSARKANWISDTKKVVETPFKETQLFKKLMKLKEDATISPSKMKIDLASERQRLLVGHDKEQEAANICVNAADYNPSNGCAEMVQVIPFHKWADLSHDCSNLRDLADTTATTTFNEADLAMIIRHWSKECCGGSEPRCVGGNMCRDSESFDGNKTLPNTEGESAMTCADLNVQVLSLLGADSYPLVKCADLTAQKKMELTYISAECCGGFSKTLCADDSTVCRNPENFSATKIFPEFDVTCDAMSFGWLSKHGLSSWSGVQCENLADSDRMELAYISAECCGGVSNSICADGSNICRNPEDFDPHKTIDADDKSFTCDHFTVYMMSKYNVTNWSDIIMEGMHECKRVDEHDKALIGMVGPICCDSPQDRYCGAQSCHAAMGAFNVSCGDLNASWVTPDNPRFHDAFSSGTSIEAVVGQCCEHGAGPPPCIAHCYGKDDPEDYCPSTCDTSQCNEDSIPPKSWIDEYFAKGCKTCMEDCDFSFNKCPTDCDISRCTSSTRPTYAEAAQYLNNGCKSGIHQKKHCGGGMYVSRKNKPDENCKWCQPGKFSKSTTTRNRRCKKCGKNKYQPEGGQSSCLKCPQGFNTKGQRGKRQCFHKETGESMEKLKAYYYDK